MEELIRFQQYEVLRREDGSLDVLGRGAMGITYKAMDTKLRCPVALKVIDSAALGGDGARRRFLREAHAAAGIRHANVAAVFPPGCEHGSYFYAIEFIEGETIDAFVKRRGAVPALMALEIVSQVSLALDAAQRQGLERRDITPSNVMLVPEAGGNGAFTVKVIDFGLAKSAGADAPADIYALGATLCLMLAGGTPVRGALAGQPAAVLALVERMMAGDPGARPQSPAVLRKEIAACVAAVGGDALADGIAPAPGVVLAGRFQLIAEYSPSDYGTTFRARKCEDGSIVAVLILDPKLLPTSEAYARLEDEIVALKGVHHPAVIRVDSLEHAHQITWIARDWVRGPRLRERLRAPGGLSRPEAIAILTSLAGGLDAVEQSGAPCPELNAGWITLTSTAATPNQPKFNPLNLAAVAPPPPGSSAPDAASDSLKGARCEYACRLAAIAYEVLGGSGAPPPEDFVPVPGLPDAANRVLREGFDPDTGCPSAVTFVARLSEALGDSAAPEAAVEAPPPRRRAAFAGLAMTAIARLAASLGMASWIAPPPKSAAEPPGTPREGR